MKRALGDNGESSADELDRPQDHRATVKKAARSHAADQQDSRLVSLQCPEVDPMGPAATAIDSPSNLQSPTASVAAAATATAIATAASAVPVQGTDDLQEPKEGKKKKNRCLLCKKKLGLTGKPRINALFVCLPLKILNLFQASPVVVADPTAHCIATPTSTSAPSTTRSSAPRRSARATL